jgi:methyl-accepting chemotaxis protein
MASGAVETTSQSATVGAAAERMSANVNSMATTTGQVSAKMKGTAAAIDQMTASTGEVAKSAEGAAQTQASRRELSQLAEQLQSLVRRFTVGEGPLHATNTSPRGATAA